MRYIAPILISLGISDVFSVDDDYLDETFLKQYGETGVEEFIDLAGDRLTREAKDAIYDAGLLTVADVLKSSAVEQQIRDLVSSVFLAQSDRATALSVLETAFKIPNIQFHKLTSIEEVHAQKTGSALWLVDKQFNYHDTLASAIVAIDRDSGADMLPNIIVIYTNSNDLVGLNNSWQERYRYLNETLGLNAEQSKRLAYSVFVISKTEVNRRMDINMDAAMNYIEQVLLDALTCYCASNISSAIKKHTNQALSDLTDIAKDADRSTLATIYYNMVTEGEPNSFRAFQTIFQLMQEAKYIEDFDCVDRYISAMKNIVLDKRETPDILRKKTIEDIVRNNVWTRYQYIRTDVNLSYADVLYGDIFRFTRDGKATIGILITQPCDCVIRKNQTGITERKAESFTMLIYQLKTLHCNELSANAKRIQTNCAIIDYRTGLADDGWEIDYIDLTEHSSAMSVPCFLMDLLSLNQDGNARVLDSGSIQSCVNKKKSSNWNDYCSTLCEKVEGMRSQIEKIYKCMGADAKIVVSSIYGVDYVSEDTSFSIRRLGRLTSNLTAYASFAYLSHTYRVGKDSLIALHDIGEQGGE